MNVDLTARERFEYNQRVVQPGDDFKATDIHAKILVNAGRATYKTRDAKAEAAAKLIADDIAKIPARVTRREPSDAPPESGSDDEQKRGTRRYRRRDMQADET
jgi:hypothetical protein